MWCNKASQKAHAINAYLLRALPITQVQFNETWHFIKRKHCHQAAFDGVSPCIIKVLADEHPDADDKDNEESHYES